MSKPVGEMNELDCLRLLIAALVGVDSNGVPTFDQDTGTGGGLTNAQLRASAVPVTDSKLPVALGAGGGLKVDGSGTALPVSSTQLPETLGAKTPALSFSTTPSQSSAAPTNTAGTAFTILTADGDVATLSSGEKLFIQNHDDVVLNFKLGTLCSTSSLSGRLKACSVADDGTGGYIIISDWTGVVSVAAASGSPRFSAWKI